MRLGLDLRTSPQTTRERAIAADRLGLWAVLVGGEAGVEAVMAAGLSTVTTQVRIFVEIDLDAEHPVTIAEELAVLDNLCAGRVGAVLSGTEPERSELLRRALLGHEVNGIVIAPPTVQTVMTTWLASHVAARPQDLDRSLPTAAPGRTELPGDLTAAGIEVDAWRRAGCTHLFARWDGTVSVLARHLA